MPQWYEKHLFNPLETGFLRQIVLSFVLTTLSYEETFLQDFQKNLEEMFLRYYMDGSVMSRLTLSTTCRCGVVTCRDRVKINIEV